MRNTITAPTFPISDYYALNATLLDARKATIRRRMLEIVGFYKEQDYRKGAADVEKSIGRKDQTSKQERLKKFKLNLFWQATTWQDDVLSKIRSSY